MIWFTIALFVVSFLVTALLAPKPDIENARAGSLDDVQFPRASEDAPLPLVLGKVRMNAPNTLWYGDWLTVPITERIKTGLFSKTTVTVGHKYYLGLDLGLAIGPSVALNEVWIDEEKVWEGNLTTVGSGGTIDEPELFGGYKGGGGWVGAFTFYPGSFPQAVNGYVESKVGAGNVPGYAGMAHVVFAANYIGESNQLRKMAFTLSKYTNDLGTINSGRVGADDMNPMEALYQIMVNPWGGLGIPVGDIDTANWIEVAETLYNEGNGVSVIVTSAQQGKQIAREILRQIDGIMYQNPTTGKLAIKLIRNDYDPDLLPLFDEDDIIQVRTFTKTTWEDVVAQVKVSFPSRDKESSRVAVSIDSATSSMIGRLKTVNMSFPFCYDETLANQLASRERAQQSVPLFRMTLEMTRAAYTLQPGDVFKISWPEYGFSELVMRVQKHDLGALLDGKIVLDCIQDSFAVGTSVFADPTATAWVAPVRTPTDILTATILDMPFFFARKLTNPVAEAFSQPLVIPLRPQTASTGFSVVGDTTTGTLEISDPQQVAYPATGTLTAAYPREAGQATGIDTTTGFTAQSRLGDFVAGTVAEIYQAESGILYMNGEWIGFENVTNNPSSGVFANIHRGLFGSSPKDHPIGTRVYQVTPDHFGLGLHGLELGEAATWYYKLLDAVGGNSQDPSFVTELTRVAGDPMRKPARPRNLQLDGTRTVREVVAADGDLPLTWVETDRETGTSYPTETAATEVTPEVTTYDVEVYIGGVLSAPLSTTDHVGTSYTIPFTALTPPVEELDCEIRVFARREDPDSPGVEPDYLSDGYASLSFTCNIRNNNLLLEGDMQSGTDSVLLEGDMQSGTDVLSLEGDEA
ncbi:MAG TPA: phage tail protein [Acidimicrobiia bacterium]